MHDTPPENAASVVEPTVKALLDEAIQLRHTLYYGIDFTTQPALSDAANRLGGVLAKIERRLRDAYVI